MSVESMSQAETRSAPGRFAGGVTVVTGMDGADPVGFARHRSRRSRSTRRRSSSAPITAVAPGRGSARPGVLMRVHAETHDVHAAGDHDVVIGRVLEPESPAGERPLIFFRGKFGIDTPATLVSA